MPAEPSPEEIDAQLQLIKVRYGSRLTEAELAEVRESLVANAQTSAALRAAPLANGDEPSIVFTPLRRRKKK